MEALSFNHLNKEQLAAIKETNGPILIVAGAGSGKTTVLTAKIAYLIQNGINPLEILALTFTNKAADVMKERIYNLVGNKARIIRMGTFHSIFARILRNEAESLGFNKNYSIYDQEDSINLIKSIVNDIEFIHSTYTPKVIQSIFSRLKNRLEKPESLISKFNQPIGQRLFQIFNEYQKLLKSNNAMDFDDLLLKPIELFNKYPSILNRYQNEFIYILVDEFQDTNKAQYEVLKLLSKKNNNICVVGDDAQSIYRWRGAEVTNMIYFNKDFPDVKIFHLEQNYRSTKSILEVSNSVIKHNENQIKKELWTSNEKGNKIRAINCLDERTEASFIVKEIQLLVQNNISPREIAVLYRTNSQSRIIEELLIRSTIPYTIVGGTEFYRRKEIKDILAYLKLINNTKDSESLLRIINFPARGIGDITLKKIRNIAFEKNCSLFEALQFVNEYQSLIESKKQILLDFKLLIEKNVKDISSKSLSNFCKDYLDEVGMLSVYLAENSDEGIERHENILQFINSVFEYEKRNPDAGLNDFLQEVSLLSDIDKWDENQETVSLMTLHSSKGLEFYCIFICGCEQGILPLIRNDDFEDLEEERRLFYVGCTRAKKQLYLTYCKNRNRFGSVIRQMKSQFFEEINSQSILYEEYPEKKYSYEKPINHKKNFYDDYYQQMPDYESFTQTENDITTGMLVEHDVFGKGKILKVTGYGENMKADVLFNNNIKKTLMLKYARLKILK